MTSRLLAHADKESDVNVENSEEHGRKATSDSRERQQREYRINLTLAVTDPQALWTDAAARLLAAPDMTLDDVLDVIGPREDPSISDCIATVTAPSAVAGCIMDDFWIDSLRDHRPRIASAGVDVEYKLAPTNTAPRRHPPARRASTRLALCGSPSLHGDSQTN